MPLILPHGLVNDTTADALPVDANFETIEIYVNANLINKNGAVGMEAPLLLSGTPTQPLHAATKAYVDAVMPIGIMMPYGGLTPPSGSWMLCNGATLSRASYSSLFDVLSTRFNVGTVSGSDFMLPNLNGRMPIGVDSADTDCNVVGEQGGTTTPPLLQHQHEIDHNHGVKTSSSSGAQDHEHSINHDHPLASTTTDTVPIRFTSVHVDSTSPSAFGLVTATSPNSTGTTADGSHNHGVNLPMTSGLLSGSGNLLQHAHTVDLDNYTGNSGNTVQTAQTKYRPPFVTVSFIIRVS